jgi:hypothetical protein
VDRINWIGDMESDRPEVNPGMRDIRSVY